jgi:soluble lytic murein transglycosylase
MGDIPRVIGILQDHFPREITRGGLETVRFWEMVYPRPYDRVIRFYAGHYGVDPALIWAMIREESWFNPEARSEAGALGLMQLMPDTARILEPKTVPFPDDVGPSTLEEDQGGASDAPVLFAPERNIALGVHFLSDLLVRFDGETVLAIAAYNAGPGAVARWTREIRTDEIDEFVEEIPYPETRRYVKRVIRSYAEYQRVGICNTKMIMSYSTKVEMSYIAEVVRCSSIMGGGRDGRKGHGCGESEGVEEAACDSTGGREEGKAERSGGAAGDERATDPADGETGTGRRRGRDLPPGTWEAIESVFWPGGAGSGSGVVSRALCGIWADVGQREAVRAGWDYGQRRDLTVVVKGVWRDVSAAQEAAASAVAGAEGPIWGDGTNGRLAP